ncbi:hypothetical protein [Heyndrickxia acidicola]|uniref:Uncharacterized protein n=1 Tax=Heyndrickxia acidicola TaxID=209389 RepID=A0ABU6MIQ2_9BACI|nr:hypothetical protein [Heyndrickxia acidicola]MED1204277.1 hypothetical protein [Heyndrickxia acidicola]
MSLEHRVIELENELAILKEEMKHIKSLLKITTEEADFDWAANKAGEWMIKVVYPGIYDQRMTPSVGFPKNRKKIADQIKTGQKMFIYVTKPVKRIIGLTRVISTVKAVEGKWPYAVDLEWVIGPKLGLTLAETALTIRPRIGETLYALKEETAIRIMEQLQAQPDLNEDELLILINQYLELTKKERVSYNEAIIRLKGAGLTEAAQALSSYRAQDGSVRGWDELAERGELYRRYPQARTAIWPDTYSLT